MSFSRWATPCCVFGGKPCDCVKECSIDLGQFIFCCPQWVALGEIASLSPVTVASQLNRSLKKRRRESGGRKLPVWRRQDQKRRTQSQRSSRIKLSSSGLHMLHSGLMLHPPGHLLVRFHSCCTYLHVGAPHNMWLSWRRRYWSFSVYCPLLPCESPCGKWLICLLSRWLFSLCVWELAVVNLCSVFVGVLAVKYLTLSLHRHILISLIVLFVDSNAGLITK